MCVIGLLVVASLQRFAAAIMPYYKLYNGQRGLFANRMVGLFEKCVYLFYLDMENLDKKLWQLVDLCFGFYLFMLLLIKE